MTITSEQESGRFDRLACLIIILLGLAVYSNTLHSSFHFDDRKRIVENTAIRDLHNIPMFFRGEGSSVACRSITQTTFALNYYFGEYSVEDYHWVNISIHIFNGILVYLLASSLLTRYFSGRNGSMASAAGILALFVALLFVTGPVQTHSVTYIVQRNGLLAAFFCLSSLLLFIKAVEGPGFRSYLYAGSVLSFLFAIWCKEPAYSAPFILFLYYQCFVARDLRSPGRGLRLMLPYVVVGAVSFYIGVPVGQSSVGEGRDVAEWGRWEYLLTQSNVVIEYIKLLLLPLPGRLNVDFDMRVTETLWEPHTLVSSAFIVGMLIAAFLYLNRSRLFTFCVLWFFVALAPTSSIVPLREVMVAYRLYLPGFAFYLLLVVGIHSLFRYFGTRKWCEAGWLWRAELAVLTGIVLFYGICTYQHNKVWMTEITLWEDAVKKSPDKIRPHFNLGHAYQSDGQVERAKAEYEICGEFYDSVAFNVRNKVELDCCSRALTNLGDIYIGERQYDRAVPLLETARDISQYNGRAHSCLGVAYVMTGKLTEGEAELMEALRIEPADTRAHIGFGVLYEKKSMFDEAIAAYTNAVNAGPPDAVLHIKLSQLLINHATAPGEAIRHLEEARNLCPDEETSRKINELMESIRLEEAKQGPPPAGMEP